MTRNLSGRLFGFANLVVNNSAILLSPSTTTPGLVGDFTMAGPDARLRLDQGAPKALTASMIISRPPLDRIAPNGSRLTMPTMTLFALLTCTVVLLPLAFGELMVGGLAKLHLTPSAAVVLVIAIFVGEFINVPVKRRIHSERVSVHPLAVFGLSGLWPELRLVRHQTIIAVNVGGGLIRWGLRSTN
jgi:hypothetical protein